MSGRVWFVRGSWVVRVGPIRRGGSKTGVERYGMARQGVRKFAKEGQVWMERRFGLGWGWSCRKDEEVLLMGKGHLGM